MWTRIYMDNLFNSRKLYTAAYQMKCLCQGVARTWGRGVPEKCVQHTVQDVAKANKLRGRTLVAKLEGDVECPDLVCCSVYDSKPVHLLSTIVEEIDWNVLNRKVWSTEKKANVVMQFLRLNMIDDYNHHMNSVDLADQLRNCYRFNHWMRNRKWGWAIFLWAIGCGATDAYIVYDRKYEEEKKKGGPMYEKWTHCEFLIELIHDFLGWNNEGASDDAASAISVSTTRRGSAYSSHPSEDTTERFLFDITSPEGRMEWFQNTKTTSMTKARVEGDYFSSRRDGRFHPSFPTLMENDYCQYCCYKYNHMLNIDEVSRNVWMKKNRSRISRCLECNVNLCWACYLEWHGMTLNSINAMLTKRA
jgi:hypothetical protein